MGRRDDVDIGVYPLEDLMNSANRETTKNVLQWFGKLEEREFASRRCVHESDYMERSRLCTSWVSTFMVSYTLKWTVCICIRIMIASENYFMVFTCSCIMPGNSSGMKEVEQLYARYSTTKRDV